MRILFSANPMFGHINPLLPLAASATDAGHAVLFATGADMIDHVRRHGVDATAVGPTYSAARIDPDEPWMEFFARVAHRRAEELVPLARRWEPDIVVHEETELAGVAAAAITGARHMVHGLGIPPPARLWAVLGAALDGLGAVWGAPDLSGLLTSATYVSPCPPSLEAGDSMFATRVERIRPTIASRRREIRLPPIVAGLHGATVHVTLGTVFNDQPAVLGEIVTAVARLPVNVIATTGPRVDGASLGQLPPNVQVHEYLPYDILLPRCAAVVSHGGAGIMFGALGHGLPQLLLPQGADQHGNAQACVRAGAGLSLVEPDLDAEAVATAVGRLLDDQTFTTAATRLRAEIEAMPDPASVVAEIASCLSRP